MKKKIKITKGASQTDVLLKVAKVIEEAIEPLSVKTTIHKNLPERKLTKSVSIELRIDPVG